MVVQMCLDCTVIDIRNSAGADRCHITRYEPIPESEKLIFDRVYRLTSQLFSQGRFLLQKRFADKYHICLMLVHHTRKQQSDDKFDMISGTNGLLGAADGAFLLHKKKRTESTAILEISGRDQQDQCLYLTRNPEKLSWDLEKAENDLWHEPPEPLLEAIAKLVTSEQPEWSGTATELVAVLGMDMKSNTLTLKLNVNAGRLSTEYGIQYSTARTHDAKIIKLTRN